MAYGVIQWVERGQRVATLVRAENGQPTGADGLMDVLAAFIEETSPRMLRQGSPGALYLAELFTAREVEAGRPVRVVGGAGALGISADEVQALSGDGYFYELSVPAEGDRSPPTIHMSPLRPLA
ncbi:hypothetical protein [Longimicrobium sp.]|uniref:hypothetical protein n=1 Tax=Longimicrobium sp. TaxID=2029185 RepID=UPI002E366D5F|nr:hypothetical protein [Longimicrobium sp.]HEX6040405.1 hypothetical protein [Longimicrobium sp.]